LPEPEIRIPKSLPSEEVTAIRDLIGTKVKELLVGLSE
jgi:hypothetical protein